MEILKRDSLQEGGFAGLKEHRLVKEPKLFGPQENNDGSWPGIGNFVYLADARFMPHGETHMHPHHEIDVISVMVARNIKHEGSLENGKNLSQDDVQVQRAGGEGFSHNEINPDGDWNRMIQLWVLPEVADFPAKAKIDVALLAKAQQIEVDEPFLAYITRGKGLVNNEPVEEGDLIRADSVKFKAMEDVQLIVIHAG